ncbi:hypothetical protein LZ32DRAFT_609251 [Colletotrichum eremochloae]|nr:hypothetical protein LZ32DRAFT_609251 [Colletotrichum eremochloae]
MCLVPLHVLQTPTHHYSVDASHYYHVMHAARANKFQLKLSRLFGDTAWPATTVTYPCDLKRDRRVSVPWLTDLS